MLLTFQDEKFYLAIVGQGLKMYLCVSIGGPKKGRFVGCSQMSQLKPWRPSRTSWGGGRPGCWGGHRPGRWSHRRAACSAPRRYGWPAGGDGG